MATLKAEFSGFEEPCSKSCIVDRGIVLLETPIVVKLTWKFYQFTSSKSKYIGGFIFVLRRVVDRDRCSAGFVYAAD